MLGYQVAPKQKFILLKRPSEGGFQHIRPWRSIQRHHVCVRVFGHTEKHWRVGIHHSVLLIPIFTGTTRLIILFSDNKCISFDQIGAGTGKRTILAQQWRGGPVRVGQGLRCGSVRHSTLATRRQHDAYDKTPIRAEIILFVYSTGGKFGKAER